MRKLMIISIITVLGLTVVAMAQDDYVAQFKSVSGSVKIIRGKSDIIPVAGTKLMRLDVIVTGPVSSGGIMFNDGTRLTMGASAEVAISRYMFQPEEAKYEFALYLKKGTAVYSSGKISKLAPESVNLSTPRAAVGVRGTRFIIKED
jgi:hypothetical protein